MKTQIYGTFGPACKRQETLEKMIEAGMTGMRLNLSHTSLKDSEDYMTAYKNAAEKYDVVPQILIDMQGPELRIGAVDVPMELNQNEEVMLGGMGIPVPEVVLDALCIGDEVLLDDGKIMLVITDKHDGSQPVGCPVLIKGKVMRGGRLQGHKSIKIVGRNVEMPVLTKHDIENIKVSKTYGITALMQPFVRSGQDLIKVREILKYYDAEYLQIFAKIENRLGLEAMDDIIPNADMIVIARGDLGNDMPLWKLPAVQKRIENCCKKYGKPYIVVTQMLASMESNPVPTRAEVSDIFNAVTDGADGVMITGESAVGKYPVEAITYLANTANEGELWRREMSL